MVLTLLAALLAALPACAADGPRLPDVGPALGVKGALYSAEDGYHVYRYDTQMTLDGMSHIVMAYGEALRELGFSIQRQSAEGSLIFLMSYTCKTGKAELGVFLTANAKSLAEGGKGDLAFVLAVPDSMDFTLGKGTTLLVEGGTRCVECGGTGKCRYCSGSGRANYGQGYETCIICDVSRICNVCDGEGQY